MSVNVLVIGQLPARDPILDTVAAQVAYSRTTIVRRCTAAAELLSILDDVTREHGLIGRLDLFDHGRVGRIHMGQDVLFDSDDDPTSQWIGSEIAKGIAELLDDAGRLRLLGCDTAMGPPEPLSPRAGRLLLLKILATLGRQRLVFGTLAEIDENDFDTNGFRAEKEIELLFSAAGAIDSDIPDYNHHLLNLGKFWNPIRPVPSALRSHTEFRR